MTTLSNTTQNPLVRALHRSGLLAEDLDYHVVRASMVIMFFFFGYQKWFPYEFERLVPFISNGPLIWWLYPVFGHAGASYFLGVSEWTFGSLLLAGFWDKRLGVLGALGSTGTFIATVTIIPFMPEGWDVAAGGFPCDDRQCALPDEGRRSARRLALPPEAGRGSPDAAIRWHSADGDASPASFPLAGDCAFGNANPGRAPSPRPDAPLQGVISCVSGGWARRRTL